MKISHSSNWWGPPKKFTTEVEERKVSWLELFYDLVYVIAISTITHHLAENLDLEGLIEYTYFFGIIFWGWLNGSLHHDLHGNAGVRTKLMTLWQMMIVAGLVVTLSSPPEQRIFNATIALMVMQLFITYLWWSVGIYDKAHRVLNRPYTVLYLLSFGLLLLTLWLKPPLIQVVFFLALIINYLPPFVSPRLRSGIGAEMVLSQSMTERLGLFTIIIFGEAILGVVDGAGELAAEGHYEWLDFGLCIMVVFAMWWIFFTLVSDRTCKPGLINATLMELLYIPTLMGLGTTGVAFIGLFHSSEDHSTGAGSLFFVFGIALSLFLLGIASILFFLEYPEGYQRSKSKVQKLLIGGAAIFLGLAFFRPEFGLMVYLLIAVVILIIMIVAIRGSWLKERG